jgi:hypothetical protein
MVSATQISTVVHVVGRVTCHIFLSIRLGFSRHSTQGRSLLRSDSVILLVDSLCAAPIETVKTRAVLLASFFTLI